MGTAGENQLAELMGTIVEGTGEALSTLLGMTVSFGLDGVSEVPHAPAIDDAEERVVAEVALTGDLKGSCILMCDAETAGRLVDLMMGGDGSKPGAVNEQTDTLGELVNQASGAAVSTAGTAFGFQCSHSVQRVFVLPRDSAGAFNDSLDYPVVRMEWSMTLDSGLVLKFQEIIDRRLAESLRREPEKAEGSADQLTQDEISKLLEGVAEEEPQRAGAGEESKPATRQTAGAARAGAAQKGVAVQPHAFSEIGDSVLQPEPRKLDLLLDVPLHLTVELGKTKRLVKDVLQLGPGSVLELDRAAGEAVDVLINGRLIAKAEVVVIDENFGVRITEIVSRADRLKELRQQQ